MEIFFLISTFIILIYGLFALIEAFDYNNFGHLRIVGLYTVLVVMIGITWFSTTEPTYVELPIKTAQVDGIEFMYYSNHNGRMVAIPSNTAKVIERIPRAGSMDYPTYQIIYR